MIPCLDKLRFQEELERFPFSFDVEGFQRSIVQFSVLFISR